MKTFKIDSEARRSAHEPLCELYVDAFDEKIEILIDDYRFEHLGEAAGIKLTYEQAREIVDFLAPIVYGDS